MIITCPNCKKKFNIDLTLIPDEGRDLKCGSCDHVWLYKVEDVNSTSLTINENIDMRNFISSMDNLDLRKPKKIDFAVPRNNICGATFGAGKNYDNVR